MERIKAVFNWSGGKDSAHALLRAMQSGKYEIVALLTTVNRDTHRSTMHGIPTALLQAQADSIGFGALQGALWGPVVFLWITFGTIFAGGVHDYFSGMMSERIHRSGFSDSLLFLRTVFFLELA